MLLAVLRTLQTFLFTEKSRRPDLERLSVPVTESILRLFLRLFFVLIFLLFVFALALLIPHSFDQSPLSIFIPSESFANNFPSLVIGRKLEEGRSDSLFGAISELNPVVGTLSLIIIVCGVLIVEYTFHALKVLAHDTPFEYLVPIVQNELMVAGCTAFAFTVILNAAGNGLSKTWFIALGYADLVIPIFAFIYCLLGLVLIGNSVRQCDLWSKAYHMKLLELLDEFFNYSETFRFEYFNWIPSAIVGELEFRIFHNIFCESYRIQRKAFAFDVYVNKVFEKFVMDIVMIRPWDWLLVCVLFALNMLRLTAGLNFGKECDPNDLSCIDEGLTVVFAIGGLTLLVLSSLLAIYSRYLKVKIMKSKGILNIDHYYSYLQQMEQQKERVEEHVRMDVAALRATVEEVKNNNNKNQPKKKQGFFFTSLSAKGLFSAKNNNEEEDMLERIRVRWPEFMKKASGVISLSMKKTTTPKKPLPKKKDYGTAFFPSSPNSRITTQRDLEEGNHHFCDSNTKDSEEMGVSRSYSLGESLAAPSSHNNDEKDEGSASEFGRNFPSDRPNTAAMIQPEFDEIGFPSHSNSSSPTHRPASEGSKKIREKEESTRRVEQEIASNFPFGNPMLYFELVQIVILLTSLYLALWVTNFVVAADTAEWKVLTLLPGLGSAIVYMIIVRTAALLKSVSSLDKEAVLEVLEQTESSRLLGITMREKILSRLKDLGDPQTELYTLFHEIDSSRNGSLSREEFASFLNAIEINFSRKKWKQIFREIDLNYDDEISFEEFFLFLFPDHDVGLALEKRRMKLLGTRVKIKADRYEKESTRRRTSILQALLHPQHASILPTDKDNTGKKTEVGINHRESVKQEVLSPRASISFERTGGKEPREASNQAKTSDTPQMKIQTSAHQSVPSSSHQNSRNNSNNPSANNTPRRNSKAVNSARSSNRSTSIIISPRITELISPRSSLGPIAGMQTSPANDAHHDAEREAEENRGIAALATIVSEDRRSPATRSPGLSPRRTRDSDGNSPLRQPIPRP